MMPPPGHMGTLFRDLNPPSHAMHINTSCPAHTDRTYSHTSHAAFIMPLMALMGFVVKR